MKFNTALLHGNFSPEEKTGSTTIPIYQSSSFSHNTAEELEAIFVGQEPGFVYTRLNNPTVHAFEKRITYLEGGIGSVACASGMAAINMAIMNILSSNDEIVSSSGIFGGTYSLFENLREYGIKTKYVIDNKISSYEKCINENTKLFFVETIGNPKLDVPNIKKLSELAHDNGIPLIVDNTVTTPFLIQPIKLGADIVIHSTSKYINGSGNSIGGIIVDSGKFQWNSKFQNLNKYKKFGAFAYIAKLRKSIFKDFGACISPFNAYLSSIGLETLGLRMERQCNNALELAKSFEENRKIDVVNYPGLKNNPYNEVAREQFDNKFGAILTIRVGSKQKAFKLINNLKYATNVSNIGDVRTLVIHPASTIYANNSIEEKEKMGVYEDLIRVSVGLEDIEDIIEDFLEVLNTI